MRAFQYATGTATDVLTALCTKRIYRSSQHRPARRPCTTAATTASSRGAPSARTTTRMATASHMTQPDSLTLKCCSSTLDANGTAMRLTVRRVIHIRPPVDGRQSLAQCPSETGADSRRKRGQYTSSSLRCKGCVTLFAPDTRLILLSSPSKHSSQASTGTRSSCSATARWCGASSGWGSSRHRTRRARARGMRRRRSSRVG